MSYFSVSDDTLYHTMRPPADAARFSDGPSILLPPAITAAHHAFNAWAVAGWSPGPLTADRVWLSPRGELAVEFRGETRPATLTHVGIAPDLAAWLLLLSQGMEIFVVVARARSVWTPEVLAGALTFLTPAFLPRQLLQGAAVPWDAVAAALAQAVADGPLPGEHNDRHWQASTQTASTQTASTRNA